MLFGDDSGTEQCLSKFGIILLAFTNAMNGFSIYWYNSQLHSKMLEMMDTPNGWISW